MAKHLAVAATLAMLLSACSSRVDVATAPSFAVVDPTEHIAGRDVKDVKVEGDTRFDIQFVRR